jgi:hypothetical protein
MSTPFLVVNALDKMLFARDEFMNHRTLGAAEDDLHEVELRHRYVDAKLNLIEQLTELFDAVEARKHG